MAVPKCRECEYLLEYDDAPIYDCCTSPEVEPDPFVAGKFIELTDLRWKSPKWCPKRKGVK